MQLGGSRLLCMTCLSSSWLVLISKCCLLVLKDVGWCFEGIMGGYVEALGN